MKIDEDMKMKAVLFDVYGTLISTGTGSINAVKSILAKKHSEIEPEAFYAEWKQLHKKRMRQTLFLTEREIFMKDLAELYSVYGIAGDYKEDVKIMLESLYNRTVFPEVPEAINRLSKKYEVIIASNTDTEPLLQNFDYNGLVFRKIYTSEGLMAYKPNPKFYLTILNECGYSPEEVLYVGDSCEEDIIAPSQLGIKTALVDRKKSGNEYGQTFSINDISQLCPILGC